ncbi:hypothetical protein F0562_002837 [Nyssa sinensis]|uniref:Uncharacterized protein n=1 Tax=Nyssa sinensis TaxID=561372 RepID=A0A5J5BUW7_9ASTE|nr:hypothetical protein F0562_002837 [Nyssa sinensis]
MVSLALPTQKKPHKLKEEKNSKDAHVDSIHAKSSGVVVNWPRSYLLPISLPSVDNLQNHVHVIGTLAED